MIHVTAQPTPFLGPRRCSLWPLQLTLGECNMRYRKRHRVRRRCKCVLYRFFPSKRSVADVFHSRNATVGLFIPLTILFYPRPTPPVSVAGHFAGKPGKLVVGQW